jgi:hypothetical protein
MRAVVGGETLLSNESAGADGLSTARILKKIAFSIGGKIQKRQDHPKTSSDRIYRTFRRYRISFVNPVKPANPV